MRESDKREVIIQSAIKVFSEKGLQNAKVDEIAERAGIAKGTVYLYFKSKHEIFQAALQEHLKDFFLSVDRIVKSSDHPEQKMKAFIRLQLREITRIAKMAFPELYPELTRIHEPLFQEMMGVQKRIQQAIAAILEQGFEASAFRALDPYHAAFCLQGIIRIHMESAFLDEQPLWDEDRIAEKISELFLHGIK